ncbi:PhzF family phenazine biosynthesis protein [Aquirufa antheringensis]|uniref:PhzF family phenazine biosynthesis protein n=1 Tax=Aquirufa antheringensis TaxID=2516559 RepID=UPI001032A8CE|nr:PhzF family phenazine biosynthesis protein [Aquirufa antheringensis]TBH71636.1 PhzF family phenazine biosynthesis protein [Aquirufa antheringensis]
MKIPIYQVDAFTNERFKGNPAAVCPLDNWLPAAVMQNIAAENNLAETAFVVAAGENFEIRWFTPTVEVDLCGHATLASAYVLFNELGFSGDQINFISHRSGPLSVTKNGSILALNFPVDSLTELTLKPEVAIGLSQTPRAVFKGKTDYLFVYDSEAEILALQPDFVALKAHPVRGIIVTAPGETTDFVSRFFGPACGVNEDPVTGSAHTTLTPYWASILGKTELTARQLSQRTGDLTCNLMGDRVEIAGEAVLYLKGEIEV